MFCVSVWFPRRERRACPKRRRHRDEADSLSQTVTRPLKLKKNPSNSTQNLSSLEISLHTIVAL